VERLHALLQGHVDHAPRTLNATNTHDTKRSADVRGRLDALSEHASEWERRLAQWRRHHRALRTLVGGKLAPTRTTDNFIYQSLVGIWPVHRPPARDGDAADDGRLLGALRERLTAYIQKAVREAKVRTSWTDPDAEYEAAISRYIAGLLDRRRSGPFLREVEQFAGAIQSQGIWNALSRIAIHLTAPGTPDLYQGDELWMQALVDPDNRRPVDWEARERMLRELRQPASADGIPSLEALRTMVRTASDGRLKLYLTSQLMRFRRDNERMVSQGGYRVVVASGTHAHRVCSYERVTEAESILVVAPRLTGGLGAGAPVGEAWSDTALAVPAGGVWRCLLTGTEVRAQHGLLAVRELLATLPVAVLMRVH
jgi:(1->4)-alpha-D-glucan 1-alpha-D-glucosylmutase